MEKLKQNVILFDLDGTLTDSAEGVIRSVQHMQETMGFKVWETADLKFVVGPPLMKTFTEDFGMDVETAEKAMVVFRARYSTIGMYENKVYAGVEEMLEALKAKGKRMGVATSKKEELAIQILEHFGIAKYFDVIGGDKREVGRNTKAKVMEYVLEALEAEKDDVIMVGDRLFDIEGAHALGVPCIAVEYGYGDREEFEQYGADYIVAKTEEVVDLF